MPRNRNVFINCPFDPEYWPLFEVLVFTVVGCGFVPLSALQEDDGGAVRIEKIGRLVGSAAFGIHDISRVGLDKQSGLPRFNMPFELGIDMGCKAFGKGAQRSKKILVLDSEPYRYQVCLSDIAGQDIRSHGNDTSALFKSVRDFLSTNAGRAHVPGQKQLQAEFREFANKLPEFCESTGLDRNALTFKDFVKFATLWIAEATRAGRL